MLLHLTSGESYSVSLPISSEPKSLFKKKIPGTTKKEEYRQKLYLYKILLIDHKDLQV